MPEGAVSGEVETPDGMKIRFARWKAVGGEAVGTVLLLHGRSEFIEKQFETIHDVRKRGFEVISFDWRGQGGSSRILEDPRRGYVDEFDQYIIDLETIFNEVALPDCKAPFYIFAHSSGALVSLLAAPQLANRVRRMVLTSPFLGLGRQPISSPMVKMLASAMCMFGLGEVYLGSGPGVGDKKPFEGNIHTTDPERYERNRRFVEEFPELAIGGPTAAWVNAACNAIERVSDIDYYKQISTPVLMIAAGADQVVSNRATERLGKRLRSGATLTIDGAKHELMQEKDVYREQLLAAFSSFVPGSGSNL